MLNKYNNNKLLLQILIYTMFWKSKNKKKIRK